MSKTSRQIFVCIKMHSQTLVVVLNQRKRAAAALSLTMLAASLLDIRTCSYWQVLWPATGCSSHALRNQPRFVHKSTLKWVVQEETHLGHIPLQLTSAKLGLADMDHQLKRSRKEQQCNYPIFSNLCPRMLGFRITFLGDFGNLHDIHMHIEVKWSSRERINEPL